MIAKILAVIGGRKLIKPLYAKIIRPELVKLATKTDSKVDDGFIKILDEVIKALSI